MAIDAGEYLVAAADVDVFKAVYPWVTNVVGGWDGKLSNSGETIELVDGFGIRIDRVRYFDQGDWGVRELGPRDYGHRGWLWISGHDGGGKSPELINADMPNEYGQNWSASSRTGGTPGMANSVAVDDIAPIILDVMHWPVIPGAVDAVTVTARILDERRTGVSMTLHHRIDVSVYEDEDIYARYEPESYDHVTMFDDGMHGDDEVGDGIYAAAIPAQRPGRIVEFYVEARDAGANDRTWPSPSLMDGRYQQVTNAFYQVDDFFNGDTYWTAGSQPVYYVIMRGADKGRLLDIGDREGGEHNSDAQVNATLVSVDGVDVKVRHNLGVRNRGHGSRNDPPNNYRLNFPHDRMWKGVSAVNLNTKYTYYQLAGGALFRMSGLPQPEVTAVQVRLNGENLAESGSEMYGSYAHLEVVDSDFAGKHFPDDANGNAYKCMRDAGPADLAYRGNNSNSYRNSYLKRTNTAEDDWSDVIELCYVMSNNTPDSIYVEEVNRVANVEEWLRFFAMNALLDNSETSLANGYGDDYYLYRGVEDPRFVLIQHDLDSILGRGGSSATSGIFRATTLPVVDRFLRHPQFVPRYYFHLKDLIETTFSPERLGPLLDDLLGDFVPTNAINQMKTFVAARNAYVLSLIPSELTVQSDLPQSDGYYRSNSNTFALYGTADAVETRSVLVNGQLTLWSPVDAVWDFGGADGIAETLVPARSMWKYLDDGSNQGTLSSGTNWFAHPNYNDSFWLEGPAELGYGDASQGRPEGTVVNSGPSGNSYITTYFRHSFNLNDASLYSRLHLRLLRDDGAVVYLNGVEAARSNMPPRSIDYLTLASSGVSDTDESTFYDFTLDASLLSNGRNVLAVEVHQSAVTSSDISFDLELEGTVASEGAGSLRPGINRVSIQTFDGPNGMGNKLKSKHIDIWYDDGDVAEVSGTLTADTTLDAASGPWLVTNDLIVPAGVTLTIAPGTTVFFDEDTRITINGRILAEGTQFRRIRFARQPGSSSRWDGLHFNSAEDNSLAYLDMEYSSRDGESIRLDNSRLLIDNVTWTGTDKTIISTSNSSLIVRNSTFPDTTVQTVSGHGALPSDPYVIFENNVFGVCSGNKQDVVDFSAGGPDPIPQFTANIFLGGGDDGLDLDGTSAHIEGNVFMNFHRNFSPEEGESYAVTTGYDGVHSSDHVIARNVFIDCDNAVLVKDRSWVTFENNTVVDCTGSGINFDEPLEARVDPGDGAYLDGNIFWNVPTTFGQLTASTTLSINRSIVPSEWHYLGAGNVDADPLFVDRDADFRLKAGSPAIGAGPCGLDMGAFVPGGAAVCGEPGETTYRTDATLTVGGPGITHYRYSVSDPAGPWSEERPVDVPIRLTNLLNGRSYIVYVIGRNSAGIWQSEDNPTSSHPWTIDTSYSRLVINEVLAINSSAVEHEGTLPDLIELYYDGSASLSLAGFSISDNQDNPAKFVFPPGTAIEPGGYLVLYADSDTTTTGIHLGFNLDGDGEGLYLYNNSGVLLDSVEFGLQLPDLSIGRTGNDNQWRLAIPTFGQANIAQPLGDSKKLRINEWLADGLVLFEEDFIELFNPHTLPVDLGGLYMTDNPVTQPDKHQLGSLNFIAGRGFAVLRADNRSESGHVDFQLSADGEMIGLFDAGLKEIDKVLYGPQTTDVSYGRTPDGTQSFGFFELPTPGVANPAGRQDSITSVTIVPENADKRVLVPTGNIGQSWRSEPDFDDSGWLLCTGSPGGVGYDTRSGYENFISLDIETQINQKNTSFYIRIPFTAEAATLAGLTELTLRIRYDDGFIAYLNGIEVARRNFNGTPAWNSQGSTDNPDSAAVVFEDIDISAFLPNVKRGKNLLAIQGLNGTLDSSDLLISAQLDGTVTIAAGDSPFPNAMMLLAGLRVTELMYHAAEGSSFDYIELQNISQMTLDLTGVRLSGGVDFTFPQTMLEPGGYIVVADSMASFRSAYGTGINVAGEYSGSLSNGGESIVLKLPAPLEAAILRFEYSDSWYPTTDGGGETLVIDQPLARPATWSNPKSWRPASPNPGRP
ncbi:MAG: lamin tail domain-containing protein [Planctomycetota bacterium]